MNKLEKYHSIKVTHTVYVELVSRQARVLEQDGVRPTLDEVMRRCFGLSSDKTKGKGKR